MEIHCGLCGKAFKGAGPFTKHMPCKRPPVKVDARCTCAGDRDKIGHVTSTPKPWLCPIPLHQRPTDKT